MTTYNVNSTRKNKPVIIIRQEEIDNSVAVKLFGRKRLAYGKDLNENLLRLLESFSCTELVGSDPAEPDKAAASDNMFDNPVEGQFWFNSTPTKETLHVWDGTFWVPQNRFGEIAANWGIIADGGQIPLPVSVSGRTFTYSECAWIVSPFGYPNTIDFMECKTDTNANVTMKYSLESSATIVSGHANYLIIAIPGNQNQGELIP